MCAHEAVLATVGRPLCVCVCVWSAPDRLCVCVAGDLPFLPVSVGLEHSGALPCWSLKRGICICALPSLLCDALRLSGAVSSRIKGGPVNSPHLLLVF